jgi:hypothetical protein
MTYLAGKPHPVGGELHFRNRKGFTREFLASKRLCKFSDLFRRNKHTSNVPRKFIVNPCFAP